MKGRKCLYLRELKTELESFKIYQNFVYRDKNFKQSRIPSYKVVNYRFNIGDLNYRLVLKDSKVEVHCLVPVIKTQGRTWKQVIWNTIYYPILSKTSYWKEELVQKGKKVLLTYTYALKYADLEFIIGRYPAHVTLNTKTLEEIHDHNIDMRGSLMMAKVSLQFNEEQYLSTRRCRYSLFPYSVYSVKIMSFVMWIMEELCYDKKWIPELVIWDIFWYVFK